MRRVLVIAVVSMCFSGIAGEAGSPSPDKVPNSRDFEPIKKQVETLRGKRFLKEVPVYTISDAELRVMAQREIQKEYPGSKLRAYQELLAWVDILPPETDLKTVYSDFLVGQAAGLYNTEANEMYIPESSAGTTNVGRKAAEKGIEALSGAMEDIVLAHEFTHALEDQHWPLDDETEEKSKASTDQGTAMQFVAEGSATRHMIEAIPAQWGSDSPAAYFLFWNLIHSRLGEFILDHEIGRVWKSPDLLVAGVPETVARLEGMPYSFGYRFCTEIMRKWGLDGLDYVYDHPPVSSAQVMHPKKFWEWRDLPVRIDLPETLPGGWKELSGDTAGEAGMAVLFGCQLKSLRHGLELARGWDGDRLALYEGPGGGRSLVWASSWTSTNTAGRYAEAWMKERALIHQAVLTETTANETQWESPDGRRGMIRWMGRRVIVLETDDRSVLQDANSFAGQVAFAEPPEDAARAAANGPLRRFNPIWSSQRDADYSVGRTLGGVLSRHDRNAVGSADEFLFGLLAESRRTASLNKWKLGGGYLVRHESESRRGHVKTTLLPWGVLASRASARAPQSPERTLSRGTVLWGLGATVTRDGPDRRTIRLLPFGVLFSHRTGPAQSSTHVLASGISRRQGATKTTTQFRLLGIPLWTLRD